MTQGQKNRASQTPFRIFLLCTDAQNKQGYNQLASLHIQGPLKSNPLECPTCTSRDEPRWLLTFVSSASAAAGSSLAGSSAGGPGAAASASAAACWARSASSCACLCAARDKFSRRGFCSYLQKEQLKTHLTKIFHAERDMLSPGWQRLRVMEHKHSPATSSLG